jgi:8-oxo-dGTP pyrophosphatase MutT (NUDIX family)
MTEPTAFAGFKFAFHPSVAKFSVGSKAFIAEHRDEIPSYELLATGAIVHDHSNPKRILLVQRAATDTMPNLWETPGGGCDEEDQSILHSVARELWEETGMKATKIGPLVGNGYIFHTRRGRVVGKFSFLVDVETEVDGNLVVRLDPNEHQNYLWVTEEEVKARKVNDIDLAFTISRQEETILQAFEVLRANG